MITVGVALAGTERSLPTILLGCSAASSCCTRCSPAPSTGSTWLTVRAMASSSSDGTMTLAHVVAAAVSAWWLRRGERAAGAWPGGSPPPSYGRRVRCGRRGFRFPRRPAAGWCPPAPSHPVLAFSATSSYDEGRLLRRRRSPEPSAATLPDHVNPVVRLPRVRSFERRNPYMRMSQRAAAVSGLTALTITLAATRRLGPRHGEPEHRRAGLVQQGVVPGPERGAGRRHHQAGGRPARRPPDRLRLGTPAARLDRSRSRRPSSPRPSSRTAARSRRPSRRSPGAAGRSCPVSSRSSTSRWARCRPTRTG